MRSTLDMAFVLSLFVPYLSFFWCFGIIVLRDCDWHFLGIFIYISFIFPDLSYWSIVCVSSKGRGGAYKPYFLVLTFSHWMVMYWYIWFNGSLYYWQTICFGCYIVEVLVCCYCFEIFYFYLLFLISSLTPCSSVRYFLMLSSWIFQRLSLWPFSVIIFSLSTTICMVSGSRFA